MDGKGWGKEKEKVSGKRGEGEGEGGTPRVDGGSGGAWLRRPAPRLASRPATVLCVGETLFDGLPSGIFLGGAPLNVACHLAELRADVAFASCVGRDRLGREARRRLHARGVKLGLLAQSDRVETGFVEVSVDEEGEAAYEFVTPAAWDYIPRDGIAAAAAAADAVVFGTLAQRGAESRGAVAEAREAARLTVCDVNLRPPFVEEAVVASSVVGVDCLKLSDEELVPVAAALRNQRRLDGASDEAHAAAEAALSSATAAALAAEGSAAAALAVATAAAALGAATGSACVVVTRGKDGAVLWEAAAAGIAWTCSGFRPPATADTVGAGDAFLAALLVSRLAGESPEECLAAGCRLGAFVAGSPGATPRHDAALIAAVTPREDQCVRRLVFADH
ncbi:hypothetical protein AB1Y20_004649 [Prymnesium parvum]|uniref:Carbohydrate kinase PfkB domain-containing protein n=1 Tax=Prymnesium parvum TaxID=97485 RepID=A0AB34J0X8_PRYPA